MKLIGWTDFDDNTYERVDKNFEIYIFLIVAHMRKYGLQFGGDYHQFGKYGAPYFDNGKKYCTSLRSWGSLMVEVLNIPPRYNELGYNYNYVDWSGLFETDEELCVYPLNDSHPHEISMTDNRWPKRGEDDEYINEFERILNMIYEDEDTQMIKEAVDQISITTKQYEEGKRIRSQITSKQREEYYKREYQERANRWGRPIRTICSSTEEKIFKPLMPGFRIESEESLNQLNKEERKRYNEELLQWLADFTCETVSIVDSICGETRILKPSPPRLKNERKSILDWDGTINYNCFKDTDFDLEAVDRHIDENVFQKVADFLGDQITLVVPTTKEKRTFEPSASGLSELGI